MYTALRATSQTLVHFLRERFIQDPQLSPLFDSGLGGTMVVTMGTPEEMQENNQEGLSVWLYRLERDEERLNALPQRLSPALLKPPPLPLRLHYLVTPITDKKSVTGPEIEQVVLGKVLETFHASPRLRGTDLWDDLAGTEAELSLRLESLSLDETSRVWEALDASYQLSVSYEVSVVNIDSALQPESVRPVTVALPEYGVIVGSEGP